MQRIGGTRRNCPGSSEVFVTVMRTDPYPEPDRRTPQFPGASGNRPRPSASPADARRCGAARRRAGHVPALHPPGDAPDAFATEAGRSTPAGPAEPRRAAADTLRAQRSGRPPDFPGTWPATTRGVRAAPAADAPGLRRLAPAEAVHSTTGDEAGRTRISYRVH